MSATRDNNTAGDSLECQPSSFSIPLVEADGTDGRFRTENDPQKPYQRDNVVKRKGIFYVNCDFTDIVHGYYTADADTLCTVLVLSFRFEPLQNHHRIKRVEIKVTFSAMNKPDPEPVVAQLYPDGHFSVEPSTQHEKITTGVGGKVGANIMGAEVAGELKRDATVERDAADATKVQGFIDREGRNFGAPNSASLVLRENQQTEMGVPTSLRAAILLKREDMSKFQAHFKVDITPNWLASALSIFKSDPKDDPVLFDPWMIPTSKMRIYDTNRLADAKTLMLKDLSDVKVTTILGKAVKGLKGKEAPNPEEEDKAGNP